MPLEPVFQSIPYCGKRRTYTDKIKAECRTDIPTDSVAKILSVTSTAVITDCKCEKGQAVYNGKTTFFVCYEDVDGTVKKCECGAEFSGAVKDESFSETCKVYARAEREKSEVNLSGVKLCAVGYTEIKLGVSELKFVNALVNTEGLVVRESEKTVVKSSGLKTGSFPIEEEREYNYKIEEVVSHSVDAVITGVQCGVNAIIVDGEAYTSSVFLQSGEKKGIIKECATYPFRAEIECDDAMPNMKSTATVAVKSFKTDIFVDEEKGISRETVSIGLKFSGETYREETVSLVEDAFSLKNKLDMNFTEISSYSLKEVVKTEREITGRIILEDGYLTDGAVAFGTTGERAKAVSTEKTETGLKISGVFTANVLFTGADGKIFQRKTEMPFETETELSDFDDCDVVVTVKSADFKLISVTEGECSAVIVFNLYPETVYPFKVIDSVKEVGAKSENSSAISVYIPMENEELWSLAKRLNCSPETLANLNPDLEFPLTGKERIVIYRQK